MCHALVPGNAHYLYLEGDDGEPGETADLQSPIVQLEGPICLQFSYFMKGWGIGELDVLLFVSVQSNVHPGLLVLVSWFLDFYFPLTA